MVLLSDSAVQQNIPFHEFGTEVQPINFTYQADEYDYNHRRNAFSQDSIAIASELISDLNKQLNFTYKLKALLGWETAMDTRRALVSVMKQNEDFRTAYDGVEPPGEPLLHPSYVFENHKRVNGMFHVLQLQQTVGSPATQMADVDNWHPKRALPAGEQSAQASTRARSKTLIAKHVSDHP